MKRLAIILATFTSITSIFAQEFDFKRRAIESFKNENYDEAIAILEKALTQVKDDAEIYYYLGFFQPLSGI